MKNFKKVAGAQPPSPEAPPAPAERPRLDPSAALAAAALVAPTLPPTRVKAAPARRTAQLNLKIDERLIDEIAERARREGVTQKTVVCRALAAAGFEVSAEDLHDRSNHRRRR